MKRKRAYILSQEHGTVQIGRMVFQPCTGASFHVNTNGGKEQYVGMFPPTMEGAKEVCRTVE